jgi:hypothetical protein
MNQWLLRKICDHASEIFHSTLSRGTRSGFVRTVILGFPEPISVLDPSSLSAHLGYQIDTMLQFNACIFARVDVNKLDWTVTERWKGSGSVKPGHISEVAICIKITQIRNMAKLFSLYLCPAFQKRQGAGTKKPLLLAYPVFCKNRTTYTRKPNYFMQVRWLTGRQFSYLLKEGYLSHRKTTVPLILTVLN